MKALKRLTKRLTVRRETVFQFVLISSLLCFSLAYAATFDGTGQWDVDATFCTNNCGKPEPTRGQFNVYLIQNGDAVTIVNLDDPSTSSITGTVSGATYTLSYTWSDWVYSHWVVLDEGFSVTASSATQASGQDVWTVAEHACGGKCSLSLSRRTQNPAIFDATGTWQYTTSNASTDCGTTLPLVSGTFSITQTGTKVTATTLVDGQQVEYRGFLSGSTYTLIRSYPDNGGTVSQVITVDLSNGGTGSGSCDWVWTNGMSGQGCGGLFDISMTRAALAVTASAGSGGSISPSGSVSVPYNGNQLFTITPNKGYRIQDVRVDGVSVGAIETYTFSNLQVAHTIEAVFGKNAGQSFLQLLLDD